MREESYGSAQKQERVIRVFVSSTFHDMQAERDELVKRVFPQLRKLCEQRGVAWEHEVELRWGITVEQSKANQVLPLCLAQIDRSRPYFIGLLGERYGGSPMKIPEDLIKQEPWLVTYSDRSFTELEMLHGALNDPANAKHAFFYFRDPAFIHSLPEVQRAVFEEAPTKKEIDELGRDGALELVEARRRKLAALRQRIRASGLPVRENYANPEILGELVLRDFMAVIERLFPEGSQPELLDRWAADHEAFALSRAKIYIKPQAELDKLEAHARRNTEPLVIVGESGMGKSALLANWALQYTARYPDDILLMHFIGATQDSADLSAMLQRILREFKRKLDIEHEIPERPDELRVVFANWLHMAAARGRVVLILDGLNQLEDRGFASNLAWLPTVIPGNVRLILSTLPGHALNELTRRGWPTLAVAMLTAEERKELAIEYLAQYSKALDQEILDEIIRAEQTTNPLYLRTLLEELRQFGSHDKLREFIRNYLLARTPQQLYDKVLDRYEHDYERGHKGFIGEVMSLLWAARWGLTEAELFDLLWRNTESRPSVNWRPFYFVAESSFVIRSGLINFAHPYLRQAVEARYLSTQKDRQTIRQRLATYFNGHELGIRQVDELPWLLLYEQQWEALFNLLAKPEFVDTAWRRNPFDVKRYWSQVESNSSFQLVEAYRSIIDEPIQHTPYLSTIAMLLKDTGHLTESLTLRQYEVKLGRQNRDNHDLADMLVNAANILSELGNYDRAAAIYKEAENSYRMWHDQEGIAKTLVNQALILINQGYLDDALKCLNEAEQLCRDLKAYAALLIALGHQANIYNIHGDTNRALAILEEQERLGGQVGDERMHAVVLSNRANILKERGEHNRALELYSESEVVFGSLGDLDGLQTSIGNQALVLQDLGKLDEALMLHEREEQLCRQLGKLADLAVSIGNQALIKQRCGNLDDALTLYREEELTYRRLHHQSGIARSLSNQGTLLRLKGDVKHAMEYFKQSEQLFRELGDKNGMARSLGNQASVLQDRGDLDSAMILYNEAKDLFELLSDKSGLLSLLNNQGSILYVHGNMKGAMKLHKEAELLSRELRNQSELQHSLTYQGLILQARGDLQAALALFKETERICRDMDDKSGIASALGNQGLVLDHQGKQDQSLALYRNAESIYRAIGDRMGLHRTLGNQGAILQDQGKLEHAMDLFQEKEKICRDLEDRSGIAATLINQAVILKVRRNLDRAMLLLNEAERHCREVGDKAKLGLVLVNKQQILYERHDLDQVMKLAREDEKIRRDLEDMSGLAASLATQASVLSEMRRVREALPLAEQAYLLAKNNGFHELAQRIKPMVEGLRHMR